MLNSVQCVQKPAIAVPLSVKSMTTRIAKSVLKLAVAVLNPAVKWQQQWLRSAGLIDLGKTDCIPANGDVFRYVPLSRLFIGKQW